MSDTLDDLKNDIRQMVEDVMTVRCHRDSAEHFKKQVDAETRRTLCALAVMGWRVEKKRP